jgi:hypothetical protein
MLAQSLSTELPIRSSRITSSMLAPKGVSTDAFVNALQSVDPEVRRATLRQVAIRIAIPDGLSEDHLCRLRIALALARMDPNTSVAEEARQIRAQDHPEAQTAVAQTELLVLDVLHADSQVIAVKRFDLLVRHLTTVDRLSCLSMPPRRVLCEWLDVVDEASLWQHMVRRPSIAKAVMDLGLRRQTVDSLSDIGYLRRLAERRDSRWVKRLSEDLDLVVDTDIVIDQVVQLVCGMDTINSTICEFVAIVNARFPIELQRAAERQSCTVVDLLDSAYSGLNTLC